MFHTYFSELFWSESYVVATNPAPTILPGAGVKTPPGLACRWKSSGVVILDLSWTWTTPDACRAALHCLALEGYTWFLKLCKGAGLELDKSSNRQRI